MPISTSTFGDERDNRYGEYEQDDLYDEESLEFPRLTPAAAEGLLKKLGGGVAEKLKMVEGVGWKAEIQESENGVEICFHAHDELLDDLLRRFEDMAERAIDQV